MEKLINQIGAEELLTLFPMNLNSDPLSETFEDETNLWELSLFLNHAKNQ